MDINLTQTDYPHGLYCIDSTIQRNSKRQPNTTRVVITGTTIKNDTTIIYNQVTTLAAFH
jgi:hypothetical protein